MDPTVPRDEGLHEEAHPGIFLAPFQRVPGSAQRDVSEWIDDKAPRPGASLAFYTLLSLAPLLIVIVAVAALVYGQEAACGQLVWQIQDLVGPEGAKAIQGMIQRCLQARRRHGRITPWTAHLGLRCVLRGG